MGASSLTSKLDFVIFQCIEVVSSSKSSNVFLILDYIPKAPCNIFKEDMDE
jgi:hypothetical protein